MTRKEFEQLKTEVQYIQKLSNIILTDLEAGMEDDEALDVAHINLNAIKTRASTGLRLLGSFT